jgi:hypothetical protein
MITVLMTLIMTRLFAANENRWNFGVLDFYRKNHMVPFGAKYTVGPKNCHLGAL